MSGVNRSSAFVLTCSRLVLMRLSVHCLATSLASLVTSSEALAMSFAHWINARLFPLPPRTSRDISAISRAIRLAAAMMSLPCEEGEGGGGSNKSCEQDTGEEHGFGYEMRMQWKHCMSHVSTYFYDQSKCRILKTVKTLNLKAESCMQCQFRLARVLQSSWKKINLKLKWVLKGNSVEVLTVSLTSTWG